MTNGTGRPLRTTRRPAGRWRAGLVTLGLLAGLLAGCGGNGLTTALVSQAHSASPGHGSPQQAMAGFFDGAARKDRGAACEYVPPETQATCKKVRGLGAELPSGGLVLGGTTDHGPVALVVLLGHVCLLTAGHRNCLTNRNPRAGLPSAKLSFADAVHRSLAKPDDPATLCVKLHGRWYVDAFG